MSDFTALKNKLEAQLAVVMTELATIGVLNTTTDDWEAIPEHEEGVTYADENTNADITEEWNERQATLSDLEREYRDIKRALQKIETGTYGICEISGEPIEPERLTYKPDARTCIAHMNEEAALPL